MRPVTTPQREMGKDPSLRVGLYYLSSSIERSHHMTMLCVWGTIHPNLVITGQCLRKSGETLGAPFLPPIAAKHIMCEAPPGKLVLYQYLLFQVHCSGWFKGQEQETNHLRSFYFEIYPFRFAALGGYRHPLARAEITQLPQSS